MTWALLIALVLSIDDGLEEARLLLHRGLLQQAEQRLLAVLEGVHEGEQLARALLLLGNIDYERGRYPRAIEHYARAEHHAAADPVLADAARDNRRLAEERVSRGKFIAGRVVLLRAWVLGTVALAVTLVIGLARRSQAATASIESR